MKRTLIRLGLTALVASALFGCGGGSDGVNGATVTVPVSPATTASTVASNGSTPSSASVQAWRSMQPDITITGVSIASPPVVRFTVRDANGAAVVGLGNTSKGTSGTASSVAALTNLRFTLAKLVPGNGTEPSKWVSYLVLKPPTNAQAVAGSALAATDSCTADRKWCGTYPTTDSEGTLVDNKDGTYVYTFYRDITQAATLVNSLVNSTDGLKLKADLGDVSFDRSLTHRLGIQISGAAPGTGSNVPNATQVIPGVNIAIPTNIFYDFRPDGQPVSATRNVVDATSCDSCHNGKGLAHGGGRKDPNFCVTCHTDQVKYGMSGEASRASTLVLNGTTQNTTSVLNGRAIGNFPNFAHKIHMGAELKLSGYNYIPNSSGVGMNFNEVEWIQDPRNCTKCHSGVDKTDINQATKTKDGDNWKTKPSRLACGACHDNVDFASGLITTTSGVTNHAAGAALDDSTCNTCHTPAVIAESHRSEAPTANNLTQVDGVSTISYEIKTVTLNSSRQPQITFRIKKDGSYLMAFNTPTTAVSSGAVTVPSSFQPITGFRSGPTFYVAYAVPQDGVSAPADFNTYQSANLASLLVASGSPKAGSITGPDVDGYFVATLTGDTVGQPVTGSCTQKPTTETGYCVNRSPIKVPSNAKMVTGAMIGNFTQVTFTGANAVALGAKYPSGLVIKTPLQQKLGSGSQLSGNAARRVVVDTNKCESCHEQLGTAVDFHGGARNDATSCAICHNPNRTSGGWSANASTFVHGIHAGTDSASVAAANTIGSATVGVAGSGRGGAGTGFSTGKRTVPFSWHRDKTPGTAGGFNAAAVVYPGILKRCDSCHVPNAVNFGLNGAALLPNLLWSTSGTGKYNSASDTAKVFPRNVLSGDSAKNYVTYITADNVVNYGNVFSFTPEGSVIPKITTSAGGNNGNALTVAGAGGATIAADTATLVESPVTSACFACHDSSVAKSHMSQYGGVMYGTRAASGGASLVNNETCLICHGYGRDQDAAVVHAK